MAHNASKGQFFVMSDLQRVSIWRALGYAFNRSWICIVFFSSVLFDSLPNDAKWSVLNEVYLSSIFCLTIGLAVSGLAYKSVLRLFDLKAGEFIGPLLTGIGMLILAPFLIEGRVPDLIIIILSALCTGFGSALVLLDVGRSYAIADNKECALEVLGATVLAALIALATFFLPYVMALTVTIAVPFMSILCLRRSNSIKQITVEYRSSLGERISRSMLIKFAACAFILGSVTGFMRDMYSFHSENLFGLEYSLLFSVGALIAAILMIVIIMLSKQFSIETLYKPVVLLCTIGFAIIPALGPGTPFPYLIVTIGYTLFEILIWVILSEVANRFQYTSIQVFGIGRALVLAFGVVSGALLSRALSSIDAMDIQTLVVISAIAVSLIAFSRIYILTEHDISFFEKGHTAGIGVDGTAREEPFEIENAGTKRLDGDGASDMPSPCEPREQKIPLLMRCQIIGNYYGLSRREIDVFHLLSSGRNAARVQEELMISAGTVNTHTHHIYQKLDIHNQQDLIDLMQNADLDAIEIALKNKGSRSGSA